MENRIFQIAAFFFLILFASADAQTYFEFDEGSFRVKYSMQNAEGIPIDFTAQSSAELDFFNVSDPHILITIYDLKWKPGHEQMQLLLRKNWMFNSGDLMVISDTDLVLDANATKKLLGFRVKADGEHSVTLKYGLKTNKQKSAKAKEKGSIYKKFVAIGVGQKREIHAADKPSLPPKKVKTQEDADWNQASAQNTQGYYLAYLQRYPKGKYASIAKDKIAKMRAGNRPADYSSGPTSTAPTTPQNQEITPNDEPKEPLKPTVIVEEVPEEEDTKESKAWKQVKEANTFSAYLDFYLNGTLEETLKAKAVDSMRKIPILFEFKETKDRENGDYSYHIQFSNIRSLKLKEAGDHLLVELADSNNLVVVLKHGMPQQVVFTDEFDREVEMKLEPDYKILHAVLEDNVDHFEYHIYGGTPPYYISFVREGSLAKECMQQLGDNGKLDKKEWAAKCNLDGNYFILIMDAQKREAKRFPKAEAGYKFEVPSLDWLRFIWIIFIPILGGLIWFIRKRI